MNRRRRAIAVVLWIAMTGGLFARQQAATPVPVEPSELERRPDLVGREVLVDDRVAYYVNRTGSEDDELQLKRTPITFRVPRRLRPASTARMPAAVVRGILEREGSRLFCRVTGLEVKPPDLERLNGAVDQLGARDYERRRAWARWAEYRASEFRDDALMRRAKALEAEVLRMEVEVKRVAVDAPQEWLDMAREARRRKAAEPEPSALAHRALRAKLASAAGREDLRSLARDVESFFPGAATDIGAAGTNLARWEGQYADDPAETYRSAPPNIRKALARRLWADIQQRLLESEPIPDLATAVTLADQAADRLPERPDLPTRLLEKGIAVVRRELGRLRLDEVKGLAEIYRARLRRPDEAQQVLRDWLEERRSKLSETDAEGRVALAVLYENLVQDRVTAVDLLRKAWTIDPNSKETADAFRTRGFLLRKDQWVEADAPSPAGPSGDGTNPARAAAAASQSLLGLTPDELQQKLIAKPNFKNYVASKGQIIEQRVYLDTGSMRYVNLLRTPGDPKPRVIADYTLPRPDRKGGPHPAR
jgi:tetratricopeptide (TPR) repeat protein